MCYRITRTVGGSVNPDPMLAMAEIGLLSNLEIWLGIIVACLPTMAPVLRTYVQPGLSKLSSKFYGSSGSPSKGEETPRNLPRPFGNSGGPSSHIKGHNNYTELSEVFTYRGDDSELRLVSDKRAMVRTDCEYGNSRAPPLRNGIYVQQQFQTCDA